MALCHHTGVGRRRESKDFDSDELDSLGQSASKRDGFVEQDQHTRTAGDVFPWQCMYCHRAVALTVLDAWEDHEQEHFRTTVAKCTECRTPYVLLQELTQTGPAEYEWDPPTREYPAKRQFHYSIPGGIRGALMEAAANLDDQRWSSAAVQARRAVEMLCNDKGATRGTLKSKLEWLRDNGHIDAKVYGWSDAVRDVGNEAAHEPQVSRADAEDAFEFAISLCELVYVVPHRFRRHKERREP